MCSSDLVVLHRDDAVTWLSLRNVPTVHLLAVDQLNTYDVLLSDDVVFTKGAYDAFVNGGAADEVVEEKPAKKAAAKKAAPKAEAEEPAAEAEAEVETTEEAAE